MATFLNWVVVSNIFYFHPYLGKIPILTNIFQMGWNHQLVKLGLTLFLDSGAHIGFLLRLELLQHHSRIPWKSNRTKAETWLSTTASRYFCNCSKPSQEKRLEKTSTIQMFSPPPVTPVFKSFRILCSAPQLLCEAVITLCQPTFAAVSLVLWLF